MWSPASTIFVLSLAIVNGIKVSDSSACVGWKGGRGEEGSGGGGGGWRERREGEEGGGREEGRGEGEGREGGKGILQHTGHCMHMHSLHWVVGEGGREGGREGGKEGGWEGEGTYNVGEGRRENTPVQLHQ